MKRYVRTAATAFLGATLLLSTAVAATPDQSKFSAIQGVNAQPLSTNEMQQITGELNAYNIAWDLTQAANKITGTGPLATKLKQDTLALADFYVKNADKINAAFGKLLTACSSGNPLCK